MALEPITFEERSPELASCISQASHSAAIKLFGKALPDRLYHYTHNADSILDSRCLWATCLAKQKDATELDDAVKCVDEAAKELLSSDISPFAARVLPLLKDHMKSRREWLYIACFCEEDNSRFHYETFGSYCLGIPLFGINALRCSDHRAEYWYQPVIYECEEQQAANA